MPRFVPSSLLLLPLALAVLPSCRPSKAEFAAMQDQLSQVQKQQIELSQGVEALNDRETTSENADRFERAELENALIELAVRAAQIEERLSELEKSKVQKRPAAGRPDPAAVYKVELGDAPVKGSATALVTIVMWTDYQCPYCARVQDTLDQIAENYGRKVRFVHKHNPLGFHPRAMPAALAAEAARRQGKFWKMNDRLFDNQKQMTDENFRKWAKKIGLKVRRFEKDMKDGELKRRIEADQAQGIALGARGTPAFFINGRFLSGAQPLANFSQVIDEEIVKAKKLLDRGVPATRIYETTIEKGKTKP